jgi:cysteinyl-tRNA synthetase
LAAKLRVNMLKIYNSLTKTKQEFIPINEGKIDIYACGMTVYDYCHLGHARTMVSFDVVVRYLRSQGYKVNFVRNITDIDDKIINRANERGISINELTDEFIQAMHEDEKALNIEPPSIEPRATQFIDKICALIQDLIDKEYAYIAENGDVYYAVDKFKDYGKLSKKDLMGQEAGSRVEVVADKHNQHDFVLWKKAKPGEPHWPSPWGEGRPGWHIECSAMAMNCLNDTIDIHGGGFDLQFPHHENEIAQSEASSGKPFANYWMHVGFLQINQEKMSKSLGNFFTIRDALEKYNPEVIRYFLLSSHYRSQLNYSLDNLENAKKALERLYQTLKTTDFEQSKNELSSEWVAKFNSAMNDDFNTAEAIAVLFMLSNEVNKTNDPSLAATLKHLASIMGLLQHSPNEYLQSGASDELASQIESLIAKRNQARAEKNWALADTIRDDLLAQGIELEDGPKGTVWRKL